MERVENYILYGGLWGRFFSYGWGNKEGPAIYEAEGIDVEPGRGSEAILKVIMRGEKDNGKKATFELPTSELYAKRPKAVF